MGTLDYCYGQTELAYLCAKDKKLGEAIARIGPLKRSVDSDLFASVVNNIVGQQITAAAQNTIWARLCAKAGAITPQSLCALTRNEVQAAGVSYKKADFIKAFAEKVQSGQFDLNALWDLPDEDVIQRLCTLDGIGVWTAEMLLIFSMQRPNVVSFGDLAIRRGMRMLYRHRSLTKQQFARYAKRYAPYGTVASFYLWAVSAGALPELTDPAPKAKPKAKRKVIHYDDTAKVAGGAAL